MGYNSPTYANSQQILILAHRSTCITPGHGPKKRQLRLSVFLAWVHNSCFLGTGRLPRPQSLMTRVGDHVYAASLIIILAALGAVGAAGPGNGVKSRRMETMREGELCT
jgi:hypothetical protein